MRYPYVSNLSPVSRLAAAARAGSNAAAAAGGHALRAVGDVVSFPATVAAFVEALLQGWAEARAGLLVPLLRAAVLLCTAMSLIVLAEKVFLGAVSSVAKLRRRRPGRVYRCDPDEEADAASWAYPMVLVQIPMYNEREVCMQFFMCPLVQSE